MGLPLTDPPASSSSVPFTVRRWAFVTGPAVRNLPGTVRVTPLARLMPPAAASVTFVGPPEAGQNTLLVPIVTVPLVWANASEAPAP